MNQKKSSFKKFFAGKGFYIALFLCVAAVGASGYYAIFHDKDEAEQPQPPAASESAVYTPLTVADTPTDYDTEPETIETVAPVQNEPAQSGSAEAVPMPGAFVDEETLETGYLLPLAGEVMKDYSADALVYSNTLGDWRTHPAVDIAAEIGSAVTAVNSGTVSRVCLDDNMGYTVEIEHADGMRSVYASLDEQLCVREGDRVTGGQLLGYVGTSALAECADAPHLHFAMCYENVTIDPADILALE